MSPSPRALLAALAVLSLPAAAMARPASAQCSAPRPPAGVLAPWTTPRALAAAGDADRLDEAALAVGEAGQIALLRTPQVRYPLRPEKPGGSVSYGGLVGLTIAQTGTYRVALNTRAWIDVVADGKTVASTGHGHGPECTGIGKMVDFPLSPGRYTLEIAASGSPELRLLVIRLP